MSIGPLLIRADASAAIGTGHIMRCLALAQAWQDAGGRATFAMSETTDAIQARLAVESCEVVPISSAAGTPDDASQTIAAARGQKCDWVVVDGYSFNADYQCALSAAGNKILFLDDYVHAQHYSADLVLNQNLSARSERYADREAQTRLLLGSRYCLLRREFRAWRDWKREIPAVCNRVLVMMGGSDPENISVRVIEALASDELENLTATVVIGGSNPNLAIVQGLAEGAGPRFKVRRDVSNMAELMAAADVAISAAGSTCWELCLLGLPALLVDVADNQTELAAELERRGCAIHVGGRTVSASMIADQLRRVVRSQEVRQAMSQRSRELVDGNGAVRVVSVLRGVQGFRLRPCRADDIRRLWEWANDPEVRAASFSSAAIPWQAHVEWFNRKFGERRSLIFIAEDDNGTAFGQVRFDLNADEADLNISMGREKRGLGLAVPLIELAVRELLKNIRCERVHAYVKLQNFASAKAFERAGFVLVGVEQVRGNAALHFACVRT